MMNRVTANSATRNLGGTWQLFFGPQQDEVQTVPPGTFQQIPAQVPGNVEIDLQKAGIIPDVTRGNNVHQLRPYETYQWFYQQRFASPSIQPGQRAILNFEGIDTLATIILNGKIIGTSDNMLIAHTFDVTDDLAVSGDNDLVVRLDSPIIAARKHRPEPIEFAQEVNDESLSIRKAAHMYGWDIMPRIISAGLWREVSLQILEPTRFESVYWTTLQCDAGKRTATVLVDWIFHTDARDLTGHSICLTLKRHGQRVEHRTFPVFSTHGRQKLDLTNVDLWWPRGSGDPALYEVLLELADAEGRIVAAHSMSVGVRTVELRRTDITTPEQLGEFVFIVNGQKIFIKGTNWVPLDALHSRDAQHLDSTFAMICDLNCNMLRCWGGNVYEDHAFFDLCDKHGVLVWQDFAMGCAIYPQTDAFAEKIRREAEAVVTKLRNHPSLALWAGNNEVDDAFTWAGLGVDPNTDRLSRQVLPEVVRRLDPRRAYLPSSPYRSPAFVAAGGHDRLKPEEHLWGPRDDFKGQYYTTSPAHFISEIGYHGCPAKESLAQMMDPEYLWPWQNNDQWLTKAVRPMPQSTHHNYRIPLMAHQIEVLFGTIPDTLDEFVLASQISQAEALKFFIERSRIGKFRRTGILWWNVRDGWPIISDAIVDYYGRRKLAYAYIKRIQSDVCAICAEPENGHHAVVIVNDTLRPVAGKVVVRDTDTRAVLLEMDYQVGGNATVVAGHIPTAPRPAMYLLEYSDGNATGHNHYLAGPRPFSLVQYKQWLAAKSFLP